MTCPSGCRCYHSSSWAVNAVDCSRAGLGPSLPPDLPIDATRLLADGNRLRRLASHAFIGMKHLRELHLNHSGVEEIGNRSFSGLASLSVLRLEHNRLAGFAGHEFAGLAELRRLHLDHNQLAHIAGATFAPLVKLELLHLSDNQLTSLSGWAQPLLASTGRGLRLEVGLAGNPWACGCGMTSLLSDRGILDKDRVSCTNNTDHRCPVSTANMRARIHLVARAGPPEDRSLALLLSLLAVAVLVLVVVVVLLAQRRNLAVCLHSRYGLRLGGDSDNDQGDHSALYDLFVSYSRHQTFPGGRAVLPLVEAAPADMVCPYSR